MVYDAEMSLSALSVRTLFFFILLFSLFQMLLYKEGFFFVLVFCISLQPFGDESAIRIPMLIPTN